MAAQVVSGRMIRLWWIANLCGLLSLQSGIGNAHSYCKLGGKFHRRLLFFRYRYYLMQRITGLRGFKYVYTCINGFYGITFVQE